MKINYKNTALGLIDDPENFNFGFPDPDITPKLTPKELKEFGKSIITSADKLKLMVGNKVEYISSTFIDAFQKGMPKLKDLFYKEEINDCGVLLSGGFENGWTHYHTYYYAVCTAKNAEGAISYQVVFMDFSKHSKAEEFALDVYVSVQANPEEDSVVTKSMIWDGYIKDGKESTYWQIFIIMFCLFKKYCDIETKEIIPTNRRVKIAGNKYVNETDKRITILDSTWFTNLVVSGRFGVSGHLRWQRYGPNNSLKKLIWIDEFEKEGYTRAAKILTSNS